MQTREAEAASLLDQARVSAEFGNLEESLLLLLLSIDRAVTPAACRSLALLLRGCRFVPRDDLPHYVLTSLWSALGCEGIDHQDLHDSAVGALLSPSRTPAIERALESSPTHPILSSDACVRLLTDELFIALLRRTIIADRTLERLLTVARSTLLHLALDPEKQQLVRWQAFLDALAHQCFWNEYVFDVSAAETTKLDALTQHMTGQPDRARALLPLLASYRRLSLSELALAAPAYATDRDEFERLHALHIDLPARERQLAVEVTELQGASTRTPTATRMLYEENPFPRWRTTYDDTPARAELRIVRDVQPHAPQHLDLGPRPRVLIAGCGTGRQVVEVRRRYRGALITALDLSRASLGYARRVAEDHCVTDVDFVQGDLHDVRHLGEPFDLVFCGGVLHHLERPEAGWRALAEHVRPGGCMRIALYSLRARQHVRAAQDALRAHDIEPTPHGIRRARGIIASLPREHPGRRVLASHSFYTMSMARDLLLHPREHAVDLPRIEAMLAALNLEFLGFVSSPRVKREYAKAFPSDPNATSLLNWENFEGRHPEIFAGMFDFWVRKSLPDA